MIWLSIFSKSFAVLIKLSSLIPVKACLHEGNMGLRQTKSQDISLNAGLSGNQLQETRENPAPLLEPGIGQLSEASFDEKCWGFDIKSWLKKSWFAYDSIDT
jgi:hypothetical protein